MVANAAFSTQTFLDVSLRRFAPSLTLNTIASTQGQYTFSGLKCSTEQKSCNPNPSLKGPAEGPALECACVSKARAREGLVKKQRTLFAFGLVILLPLTFLVTWCTRTKFMRFYSQCREDEYEYSPQEVWEIQWAMCPCKPPPRPGRRPSPSSPLSPTTTPLTPPAVSSPVSLAEPTALVAVAPAIDVEHEDVVGKGKVIPQGTRAEQRTRGGTAASHFSEFSLKRRFYVLGRGLWFLWITPLSFVGGGTYMLVLAGNVAVDDDYWRGCGAE